MAASTSSYRLYHPLLGDRLGNSLEHSLSAQFVKKMALLNAEEVLIEDLSKNIWQRLYRGLFLTQLRDIIHRNQGG